MDTIRGEYAGLLMAQNSGEVGELRGRAEGQRNWNGSLKVQKRYSDV